VATATIELPDGLRISDVVRARGPAVLDFDNRFLPPTLRSRPEDSDPATPLPDASSWHVTVDHGDSIVATAFSVPTPFLPRDTHTYSVFARVDPSWSRRGVGSALLAAAEAHASQYGAVRVIAATWGDDAKGFLEGRGYREFHRRLRWVLDLGTFDPARHPFDDILRAADTELRDLGSVLDDESIVREMYDTYNVLLQEMPLAFPPPRPKLEEFRAELRDASVMADASFVAIRRGRVVGLAYTLLERNGVPISNVNGAVGPGRGRRLPLALKLAVIARLKAKGLRYFVAFNDEDVAPSRRILRTLGFVLEPVLVRYDKRI